MTDTLPCIDLVAAQARRVVRAQARAAAKAAGLTSAEHAALIARELADEERMDGIEPAPAEPVVTPF